MRALLVLLVAAGCVRSDSVQCAGGTICGGDQICVRATDTVTVCADPDQRDACAGAGVVDGEACDGANGRCYDGTCLPISCGDRLADPTEQCDDGNTIPGDGCSADCASNETCGNGVVDPIAKEICDDGNAFGHDGCTAKCRPETPRWRSIVAGMPDPMTPTPMAYMPSTGRVIAFPEELGGPVTLEWNGIGWELVQTGTSPSPRTEHVMVYDDTRGKVVLFGSLGQPLGLRDTWEFDGERWALASIEAPGYQKSSAAYDARGHRVIMFGGEVTPGPAAIPKDETWAYDGTWTQVPITQTTRPPARAAAAMAYDAVHGVIVMFGGASGTTTYLADTWTFDGTSWTRVIAPGPPARSHAVLFADRNGLVLYGGTDGLPKRDAWRWDGATWKTMGNQLPGARSHPHVAVDTARGRAVLYGDAADRNVWEWDGMAWAAIDPRAPSFASFGGVAHDPLRHRAIAAFGAATSSFEDGSWTELGAAPDLQAFGFVWDTARDRGVLFGGEVENGPYSDVTSFYSPATNAMTSPALVPRPSPRSVPMMAYDPDRGVTVLVGGSDGTQRFDDTWELDTSWHLRAATIPKRGAGALAYDPVRKQMLLFGGIDTNTAGVVIAYGDTWSWNGTTWTELHPPGPTPPPRVAAGFAWNPSRRRLTLHGGSSSFVGLLDDVWEWTGDRWEQVRTPQSPLARGGHFAWPASDGTGVMIFGGSTQNGEASDLWELTWVADDVSYERCLPNEDGDGDTLATCADPDCWWTCAPLCGPGIACPTTAPRCGDGMKGPAETCQVCPADATACPVCGDFTCEAGESMTSCRGDCP